jgi:hypothetical protein
MSAHAYAIIANHISTIISLTGSKKHQSNPTKKKKKKLNNNNKINNKLVKK